MFFGLFWCNAGGGAQAERPWTLYGSRLARGAKGGGLDCVFGADDGGNLCEGAVPSAGGINSEAPWMSRIKETKTEGDHRLQVICLLCVSKY